MSCKRCTESSFPIVRVRNFKAVRLPVIGVMEKLTGAVLLMKSICDVCGTLQRIYLITHMLKRSCHFSDFITCRKGKQFISLMQQPSPISQTRRRRRRVRRACLHNLPRRLFLTIWMQSQSASLPTAPWRSARAVRRRRAPGFKTQQSDGLSLTPSRLSVSPHPPPPPSNLLHARTFTPSLITCLFFFFSSLAFISLLSLPCFLILESSHIQSPLHHQFVTKVEFHPFIFLLFFFSLGCHHPSLPLPPLPPLTQPICLFTFWQTSASLY